MLAVRCVPGILFCLALASPARAHDADVIYVAARHGDQVDVIVETITLTAATLARLVPLEADETGALTQEELDRRGRALVAGVWEDMPLIAGGRRCDFLDGKAWLRESFVELTGRYRCGPGELRQDFRLLRVLPPNYKVVLGSQLDGEAGGRGVAQGALTMIAVPRPAPLGAWDTRRFVEGFEAGARRTARLPFALAWVAAVLALTSWRRALAGLALGAFVALPGGWIDLGWEAPLGLLAVSVWAAARTRPLPLVVTGLVGLSVAVCGGGGPWPMGAGQGVGVALGLAGLGLPAAAVGVMLGRRATKGLLVRRLVAAAWVLGCLVNPPWLSW